MSSKCAKCQQALTISVHPDSDDEDQPSSSTGQDQTVPDDVHLSCGCHFHWECMLDAYEYSTCPNCNQSIVTHPDKVLVDLNNEGGLQHQIDIAPILKEESYLRAYPEERRCRAFLEFCREGDHRAIAQLLLTCEDDDEDDEETDKDDMTDDDQPRSSVKTAHEILRYQDPIGDMQSGLHCAVANGHREVAWMLLLLASSLPELDFPALVYQEAAALGVMRENQGGKQDIRGLRDSASRTAEDVAREVGVIWTGWVGNGRLAMPEGGASAGGPGTGSLV